MGCWGLVLGQDRFLLMEFLLIDKWGNYFAKLNKTKNTTTLNIAQLFKSLFYYFSGLQWQRITCKLYTMNWPCSGLKRKGCRRSCDHMVVGCTITYAISAYHHWSCEFKSRSGKVYSIQHYVIKFVSDLRHVSGFLHQ
jgi:hypothetical protein